MMGLTLVVALATPLPASASRGTEYPSWDDVQRARASVAATATAVSQLEGLVVRLAREADALGVRAMRSAEAARTAAESLDAAAIARDRLTSRAEAATVAADRSRLLAGRVIGRMARQGGTTAELLVADAAGADSLLYRLGVLDRLGDTSTQALERATLDRNSAAALAEQADAAQAEYAARQRAAADAADAAARAADAAVARVTEQQQRSEVLYEQLAALKGTTAAAERAYTDGLIAAQPTAPTPVTAPAPTQSPAPTPSATPKPTATPTPSATPAPTPSAPPVVAPPVVKPPVVPTPDPPVAGKVQTAIAFARSQLGDAYVFNGSGPDGWDCSGLTKASYASAGVHIGTHSATNQYQTAAAAGRLVPIGSIAAGDLLFYGDALGIYHVALYVGGGRMIEAPYAPFPVREVAVRSYDLLPQAARPTG